MKRIDPRCLVFIDESGANLAMGRSHAWVLPGEEYVEPRPMNWGDTGTVIYANSVLGARSNFEGGPAALAASLTGLTPAYGFHLDENRGGNILVEVEANLESLSDWGAVGRIVGEKRDTAMPAPA